MKKVIILASTLVLSSTAFAATSTQTAGTEMKSTGYSSQEAAFEAGYDMMDELNTKSSFELSKALPASGHTAQVQTFEIEGMEVTVEKFAVERGEIQYRAVLDVNYQYKFTESGNS
ncbi:DUF3316 domain-containing protein [Vibrio makurazakiensis]|uniref:DUF3316 domain-containing protein n=1 Tax=Vibrio makurazakiensis TaxID=2910250 RepID=UPI003D0FE7CB